MSDLTLGQYYPTDSFLHRLDPRTKFVCTIFFLLGLFAFRGLTGYLIVAGYLLLLVLVSNVPLSRVWKGIQPLVILILATLLFQTLTGGGDSFGNIWIFSLSYQGLQKGVRLSLRIICLVVGAAMLTYTTTPTEIADGIEQLLSPLTKFKIPVHDFAFMILVAIKFVPILMDETDKIMKAQMARGVDFQQGSLMKKAKNLVPILVPVLIATFTRANELGVAMDARCYRGGQYRSNMNPLVYQRKDYVCYLIFLGMMIAAILLGRLVPLGF